MQTALLSDAIELRFKEHWAILPTLRRQRSDLGVPKTLASVLSIIYTLG